MEITTLGAKEAANACDEASKKESAKGVTERIVDRAIIVMLLCNPLGLALFLAETSNSDPMLWLNVAGCVAFGYALRALR